MVEATNLRQKQMTHRFPCQDAYASNRWISFFSCRVLQLLRLEATAQKRLPTLSKYAQPRSSRKLVSIASNLVCTRGRWLERTQENHKVRVFAQAGKLIIPQGTL